MARRARPSRAACAGGTCRGRARRRSSTPGPPLEHRRPEQRVPRLLEAGRRSSPRRWQGFETPIGDRRVELAVDPAQLVEQPASRARAGRAASARIESSRRSKSEPRSDGAAARARARRRAARRRGRGGAGRGRSRAAPRALRASPSAAPPASSSKKSLIRFFSVSRSISSIFLIATAVWFATARARSTSTVPSATQQPEQLVARRRAADRDGATGRRGAAPGRARRGRSSRGPRLPCGADARSRSSSLPGRAGRGGSARRAGARGRARSTAGRSSSSVSARAIVSPSSVRCSSSPTRRRISS